MSSEEPVCPKCGGRMRGGALNIPVERSTARPVSPFMPGTFMGGISPVAEVTAERLYWEERTGEKKGVIFKRDETRKMKVAGLRCTLCGFIELYAHEK